jgi:hypothetical protein
MPYTPEIFNRYNSLVQESRNAVSRHIQYLLKPDSDYPKGSDERLKELYNMWRADCRAMDAACEESMHLSARHEMIKMPPDDAEHFLCRRMAAVVIESYVFGEHNAQEYLHKLIESIKASNCHTHDKSCACRPQGGIWTYSNQDLVNTLLEHYKSSSVTLPMAPPLRRSDEHVKNCACGACHNKRVANGTQDAYMAQLRAETDRVLAKSPISKLIVSAARADDAIDTAFKMPGGNTDDGFVKNLFQTVQGVKFDDKCPHDMPFYACMSCSH